MPTEFTTEDQLITDLIEYWTTTTTVGTTFTGSASTDRLTTATAHGLSVGARVRVVAGTGSLPTGLAADTDYYVLTVPTTTTLTLAAVRGGTLINVTADGGTAHLLKSLTTNIPSVTAATPVRHFRDQSICPIPAIIIGHEGFEREKAKGMTGTGRVALRIALRTDMDVMDSDDHRAQAAAIDRAVLAVSTQPGPLALTYLHAVLRESPDATIVDRRQITLLRYQVVATRMEPV